MERPRAPATLWPGAFALGGAALVLALGAPGLAGRLRDLGRACLSQALAPAAALERGAGLLVAALAVILAAAGAGLILGAALRRRLLGQQGAAARGSAPGVLLVLLAALALLLAHPLHRLAGTPATGPDEALGLLRLVGLAGLLAAAAAGAAELLRERAR